MTITELSIRMQMNKTKKQWIWKRKNKQPNKNNFYVQMRDVHILKILIWLLFGFHPSQCRLPVWELNNSFIYIAIKVTELRMLSLTCTDCDNIEINEVLQQRWLNNFSNTLINDKFKQFCFRHQYFIWRVKVHYDFVRDYIYWSVMFLWNVSL